MTVIPDLTRTVCDRALKRLAEGDIDALETIYHRIGRKIFITAFSVLGDTHAAEDVMQDTFLRLTEYAHAYREEGNAVAYILTVTRRLAINELEKRKREFPAEEIFGANSSAEDALPLRELDALRTLPEEDRQIVILRLDTGMKHRDIAALLGMTPAACEKRYQRALKKLKDYYDP
ncbi:MAG: sigma-70 family RNA polymerase sigma factor [Clostridia bacterium]|nr:sigma-70 family RNA polymerase sigma factor [Clostridia bacterium]